MSSFLSGCYDPTRKHTRRPRGTVPMAPRGLVMFRLWVESSPHHTHEQLVRKRLRLLAIDGATRKKCEAHVGQEGQLSKRYGLPQVAQIKFGPAPYSTIAMVARPDLHQRAGLVRAV
jgi:hypothetical protein